MFNQVMKRQVSGNGDADGKYAYDPHNAFYKNKLSFNKDFSLNQSKKNVFVMLHALNDYPHSHFRWMIFKDFYDWMNSTLIFAKKNTNVNWIFKQHPSIKYYPTKDISYYKFFSNLPNYIVYIDEKNQIDTRSLKYCADAVVTCFGSIGFELPAMSAIPTIVASDNFYTQLGFAYEPENKSEYFRILQNIHTLGKLDKIKQLRAKAAYIFIYEISRVDLSCAPVLSLEDQNNNEILEKYWKTVLELYVKRTQKIYSEINSYIHEISKPNFHRLLNTENVKSAVDLKHKYI
jgi:hypothetical protein